MRIKRFSWVVLCLLAFHGVGADLQVDFRYAPRNWQTAICLPDDWQKTLVSKGGALLYDYPGRGLECDTAISFGLSGDGEFEKQELLSPRVPIVRTSLRYGAVELLEEAFAVAPPLPGKGRGSAVERIGTSSIQTRWASPPPGSDPAFANIALGRNGPIRYRFKAKPDASYTVGFGLCEGYYKSAGQRILDLYVEGCPERTVDMVAARGPNLPAVLLLSGSDVNGDGWIDLSVSANEASPDRNTFLNTLWVFKQADSPTAEELLAGTPHAQPLVRLECGQPFVGNHAPRHDLVTLHLHNAGRQATKVSPVVTVTSEFPVTTESEGSRARIGSATELLFPERVFAVEKDGKTTRFRFAERVLDQQAESRLAFGVVRGQYDGAGRTINLAQADKLRTKAAKFWEKMDLPYGKLEVPDPGIQGLLDSSIRNIYQAREIKNGLPSFQVGPTCYRGLWVVDGSFLLEAVTYLGRAKEARSGLDYLMSFQRPDGSFMLIDGHYKETGIALWALTRHARLTGDKAWLRSIWPRVERGFAYIREMRSMPPADAPNARLVPAGFSDGGLSGKFPEYSNVYWTLAGVHAAIEAARWLGEPAEADDWQKEFDDFLKTFRSAAGRDMRKDSHGNSYLPVRMQTDRPVPPQKAQWAFLQAVFPGRIFDPADPLVCGNMAMLRATECEGLVLDTGWLQDGLWTYFGSFYAHAWLWLGNGPKAAETLYAFGNHASPLMVWREEQMPVGGGDKVVGDMPHNWASAEMIRLVRHSLILERGSELHLMEAMPRSWTKPGAVTRANKVATEFGPVSLECRVAKDGKTAMVKLIPPSRNKASKVILHLDGWSGQSGVIQMSSERTSTIKVNL